MSIVAPDRLRASRTKRSQAFASFVFAGRRCEFQGSEVGAPCVCLDSLLSSFFRLCWFTCTAVAREKPHVAWHQQTVRLITRKEQTP